MAEGVLPIGIAGANRLNDYIHQTFPKTYLLEGQLGMKTDTGDLMGKTIIKEKKASLKGLLDREGLQRRLQHQFSGEYLQRPPSYSAAKHQGRPLYHWARKGISIKKDPVLRHIFEFNVVAFDLASLALTLQIVASSGTYMRTLFEDCAQELGTWGALKTLVRLRIGPLETHKALQRGDWPDRVPSFDIFKHALRVEDVVPLPHLTLGPDIAKRYHHGQSVPLPSLSHFHLPRRPNNRFWVFDHKKRLLGMGEGMAQTLRPLFNWPQPHPRPLPKSSKAMV